MISPEEHFEGDGLMIFFNDPIELENPAASAIRMALSMQEQFVPLQASWRKRAFDLALGIGIAEGYATLGAIGFDERWEYACIGSVTNRAARLCSEAKGGEILIDQKALASVEEDVEAEPLGAVTLKGIGHPISVYRVIRWLD